MTVGDPDISPQSWEYRLVASVVIAVEQRVRGARGDARTRWNGRVLEESDETLLGSAHADGSLAVSVEEVLEPLRRARDLDRPLTDAEAWALRDAMDTLVHEAAHLMASAGDPDGPEAYPYDDAASAYDEGHVELWTKRNLDTIISDVFADAGLDKVAAAVQAQPNIDAYPAFTTAVRHLDKAVAEWSGLTSTEVTQKLLCADDAQRWNVAVDLMIDERLVEPGLMPEAHRAEVREQLVAPLRASLAELADIQGDESLGSDEKTAEGAKAAQTAIAGLETELNRIERKYRIDNAARAQQRAQRMAQRSNGQAQGDLPPDLKRLRALTSPQAGAAGATKHRRDPAAPADGARPRGQLADRAQPSKHTPGRG